MFKKIFLIISVFFLLLVTSYLLPVTIFAADEFGTSYDVVYDVSEEGITTVTEKVTLKNLTSQYYASQFKLTIGATQISDVKAFDEGGVMDVKAQTKDNSTTIDVKFNQQVAGINKTYAWNLQFKSKDFAEKQGKVWEVRAPKISSTQNLESYNLTISIPESFGDPTLISPIPKTQSISGGKLFLTFAKDELTQSGVSANFGNIQLFDFDLTYHLENNNLFPILTNIALPPDTSFQDVIFQRLDPKPLNVTIDDDGNYLAWYHLLRGQKMDVKLIGSAKLYTHSKVKEPSLDENLRKKYTQADKYWEKDNPAILSKLSEIFTSNPPSSTVEKERLIYRYVVDNLKYDSKRLNENSIDRLGAVTALNNPTSAVCMEFTDLFIALSRAAGIPAREMDGFAYSSNATLRPLSLGKDILHAWPEYFDDKKGWVMVDPTWENTTGGVDYFSKLDLNHFTFTIKGLSSNSPAPAGSYKYSGKDSRDVVVTLSDKDFLGKAQLDVKIDAPDPIISGFPAKIKVLISNSGNALYQSSPMAIFANDLTFLNVTNTKSGSIPSFGKASFEYSARTKSLLDNYSDKVVLQIAGQKYTKDISVKPLLFSKRILLLATGATFVIVFVYFIVLGGLIFRKRFLKKSK